jgi:hypothetical protein
MKLFLLFFLPLILSACAAFNPRVGMSVSELSHMTAKSFNGGLELISADGTRSVYRVPTKRDIVYVFESNRLVRVEQAQQAQIRFQVETIKK